MKNKLITDFEEQVFPQTKRHPDFRPGDTVRVHYKVEEGTKTKEGEKKFRIQAFEGVCIRLKKGTVNSTFTVRRICSNGVGVERVMALCSPYVEKIDLVAGGSVRRSRLFFLRERSGKSARIKTRRLPAGTRMTTETIES